MKAKDVVWTEETYNSLINAYGRCGNIKKAFEIFDYMKANNVLPSKKSYTSLINACIQVRDINRAFKVFEEMKAKDMVLDEKTYTSLINACIQVRDENRAFEVFEKMKAKDVVLDEKTYTSLINACGQSGDVNRAFKVFDEMKEEGLKPDEVAYNSLIDILVSSNRFGEAKNFFRAAGFKIQTKGEDIDCHGYSHGSAFVQLLLYLDQKKDKNSFNIITGKGLHSKNEELFKMKDFLIKKIRFNIKTWNCVENKNNIGTITLRPVYGCVE